MRGLYQCASGDPILLRNSPTDERCEGPVQSPWRRAGRTPPYQPKELRPTRRQGYKYSATFLARLLLMRENHVCPWELDSRGFFEKYWQVPW
jgi:hypothetical protein